MIIEAGCGCKFKVERSFNDGQIAVISGFEYAKEIHNSLEIEKFCDRHNKELTVNMIKNYKEEQQKSMDKLMGYVYGK